MLNALSFILQEHPSKFLCKNDRFWLALLQVVSICVFHLSFLFKVTPRQDIWHLIPSQGSRYGLNKKIQLV